MPSSIPQASDLKSFSNKFINPLYMDNWQAIASLGIFAGVIFLVITEWIHLTIAAMLGALLLVLLNIMSLSQAIGYIGQSHGTLGLFFGVMIMVRAFEPTKVFDYLASQIVIFAQGKGSRLLLGIVGIVTPICAVLPNATTVMLLAPLIPPMAQIVGIDFVPLLILMVFVANSAGLLSIVGDPATFIVGSAINLSFTDYLWRLSLGGAIAILVIIVMLPFLFRKIWVKELENIDQIEIPVINHPRTLIVGAAIALFVLVFFVIGESLPIPVTPATVALVGAVLALLLAHHNKIDNINNILRDVDWSTLIFFMSVFVLIGGLQKTGVIASMSGVLAAVLGQNIALGSIVLIFFVGLISSVVPNIPLVVAMVPLLKEYVVKVGFTGSEVLSPDYAGQFPDQVLPLFYAMMFGATLGGNGTLVGASANIVAAGIAELHGRRIKFKTFFRYGFPVMIVQLVASAIYVGLRFLI